MKARLTSLICVSALFPVLLAAAAPAAAKEKGFKAVVRHIETSYNARRMRIPLLGVARFAVKFIRPAGLKDFQLAVFEDQDFSRAEGVPFEEVMRSAFPKEWQPLLQVRSRGERVYIYAKSAGKDLEICLAVFEAREAVVVQAKVNPETAMKYVSNPGQIMASLPGGGSGGSVGRRGVLARRYPGEASLDALAAANRRSKTAAPAPDGEPGGGAPAESESKEAAAPPNPNAIRIETRLVNLNVKAMDRAGQPIAQLRPEDFVVYEDGIKQEVAHFTPVTAPVSLVLLLDLSGSTSGKRKIMAEAAKKFIDALGPGDRVALAAFTRKFYPLSDFTTDRKTLKEMVDKIKKIQGGTAFYDAMWQTLDLLDEVPDARKAIVVLTDGIDESLTGDGDEGSSRSFAELLGRVSEEDATIYPVHVGPGATRVGGPAGATISRQIAEGSRRPRDIARAQLYELAEQTAGVVFPAADESDLEGIYERVAAELRQLYSLAYSPESPRHDGGFRKISVKVNRDGAVARTRRGYIDK
ncbi:MAG TPA: VWA domain-containing protein [Blastocatellia bacterium]|nr:VWA domain-containing protein [Blastocatellia bacterium]